MKFLKDIKQQLNKLKTVMGDREQEVLLLTHRNCLDGMGCQMLTEQQYPNTITVKLSPNTIKDYVKALDTSLFDLIIIADLSVKGDFVFKENVVMFDHHITSIDMNLPDHLSFVNVDQCGAMMLHLLFQALNGKIVKRPMIKMINDNDLWIHENSDSKVLNYLYYHVYDETQFKNRFRKFPDKLLENEKQQYISYMEGIEKKADEVELLEFHDGCYVLVINDFNNDLYHSIMTKTNADLLLAYRPVNRSCSVRSSKQYNVSEILNYIGKGGGHTHSGGFTLDCGDDFYSEVIRIKRFVVSTQL